MKDHLMNMAMPGFALIAASWFMPPRSVYTGAVLGLGLLLVTLGLAASYERR